MAQANQAGTKERIKSAIGVAIFHALLGYALVTGLAVEVASGVGERLKVFDVAPEPPPPPIAQAPPAEAIAPEGAASPPDLKAAPAPIVAPPPEVRLEVPPPVIAAPLPGQASDPAAGASTIEGPGTGAGGEGTGTGSGSAGSGTGGGGGVRARLLRGELSHRDYPRSAGGGQGKVLVRIFVGTNGRVSRCEVTQSSGSAALDETSCKLIQRRYRYAPARDAQGRPIPDVMAETHVWWRGPRRRPPGGDLSRASGEEAGRRN
jgi:protein TonB